MRRYSLEAIEQAVRWLQETAEERGRENTARWSRQGLYYGDCANCGPRTYADLYEAEVAETCVRRCRACHQVVDEGIPF